jgi:hypothetical protein
MKKEIFKVIAATALCLGLFGAAFLGLNHITLASATEGTQPLQLAQPAVNIPNANAALTVSEENRKPDMAFDVIFESDAIPSINALSPEAAAEIGAQYIWDMFGKSIDGMMVEFIYSAMPSLTRTLWKGLVVESDTLCFNETWIEFAIDSITGERIDIINKRAAFGQAMPPDVQTAVDAIFSDENNWEAQKALRMSGAFPEITDAHYQAAREFAERHFSTTEVISVESVSGYSRSFDFDDNGNLVRTDHRYTFDATDSTGRVASVRIDLETKQPLSLSTSWNDMVPGFNYVINAPWER